MNVQPRSCARRRISKMREGFAAAGWTCNVAVVCMVLPRSVVESEEKLTSKVNLCKKNNLFGLSRLVGCRVISKGYWTFHN